MIARASGLWMGVCMFSRPRSGVGIIAMPNVELDTMRHVEVPPGCWCATTASHWGGGWSIY